jgi:acetyl esterase/lipase
LRIDEILIGGYRQESKGRAYLPNVNRTTSPIALFFHGGGILGGSRDGSEVMSAAQRLARMTIIEDTKIYEHIHIKYAV